MITLVENDIKVEEYLYIRNSVSWKKLSNSQAQKAIDNSLFFVKAIDENGKLCGDCSKDLYDEVKWITPVPGGVGPMTMVSLMNNTLLAATNAIYK